MDQSLQFLSQYHRRGVNQQVDWRDDLIIVYQRQIVKNQVAEIINQDNTSIASFFENLLFRIASSKEEYMNLNTLPNRLLQILLRLNGRADAQVSQQNISSKRLTSEVMPPSKCRKLMDQPAAPQGHTQLEQCPEEVSQQNILSERLTSEVMPPPRCRKLMDQPAAPQGLPQLEQCPEEVSQQNIPSERLTSGLMPPPRHRKLMDQPAAPQGLRQLEQCPEEVSQQNIPSERLTSEVMPPPRRQKLMNQPAAPQGLPQLEQCPEEVRQQNIPSEILTSEVMPPPRRRKLMDQPAARQGLPQLEQCPEEVSQQNIPSESLTTEVMPPPRRRKLMDQPAAPQGLPQLEQCPEEVSQQNIPSKRLTSELMPPSKRRRLMDQPAAPQGLAQLEQYPEEAKVSSQTFISGTPCISEKLSAVRKEEVHPSIASDFDVMNPKSGEITSEKLIAGYKKEQTKCELIAPSADHGTVVKFEKAAKSVSLIDFFTAEQTKDHISSLRQWKDQIITKQVMEDTIPQNVQDSCSLCTANKLFLAPPLRYCSNCETRIKSNVKYYCTGDKSSTQHCFCSTCYNNLSRCGNMWKKFAISKEKLQKKKNDDKIEESWVQCDKCEGWQHQICALYNSRRDLKGEAKYNCPKCHLEELETGGHVGLPKNLVVGAKDLPTTKLSDHIEQRLFRRLKQEKEERRKNNLDEVEEARDLVVREVSSLERQLKVKENYRKFLHDDSYPVEFPYKSKAILLFQKMEGVDVCIFGMYVQEFGYECGKPNQRCVYISYLDSVKYFRPEAIAVSGEALRTFVYHEILIGYLDYCKKRGFTTCYIWACPPSKGDDYILYCHPENQRTPKPNKLRQWYRSLLRKAVEEKVVVNFSNLYDHFFGSTGEGNTKVARLPYFDGAYWTTAAENVIGDIEQEIKAESEKKKKKKLMTKTALKAMGHNNSSDVAAHDILLMNKLGNIILPKKEDFIVVHLQRCHEGAQKLDMRNTEDQDPNEFFVDRNNFMNFCQLNNYQFDTLRRAKYSSMMIIHHLYRPNPD